MLLKLRTISSHGLSQIPPKLERSWLAKSRRGKCVISHTFTPSRITTVSFSSLRDFKLGLISHQAFNLLTLLALCKLISPFTAIQLESCGRSQFVDPELVLSVFHLNCHLSMTFQVINFQHPPVFILIPECQYQ